MKVLIVGMGGIGQRHLRNIHNKFNKNVELIAYRSRGRQVVVSDTLHVLENARIDDHYPVKIFHDLDEALAQQPRAAFICNPSSLHVPVALKAALCGCHIFLEKPVSHNLDGIDELLAICREKQLVTYVGFQMRYHPIMRILKEKVVARSIGRIVSVMAEVAEYMPGWHKYEDYREIYAARRDLGGGVVLSQIHELDYLMWLFGAPKRVCAMGGHLSTLDIDVEDTADILMEMPYGDTTVPVALHMDFLQRPPSRWCKVVGDKGRIEMNYLKGTLTCIDQEGNSEVHDHSSFLRNEMFIQEIDHFFDCIERSCPTQIPLKVGVESLKLALDIKQRIRQ